MRGSGKAWFTPGRKSKHEISMRSLIFLNLHTMKCIQTEQIINVFHESFQIQNHEQLSSIHYGRTIKYDHRNGGGCMGGGGKDAWAVAAKPLEN